MTAKPLLLDLFCGAGGAGAIPPAYTEWIGKYLLGDASSWPLR